MGGRGTFAAGNSVPYSYQTVGTIEGVKVLQPVEGSNHHGLPESSHSSDAYIKLDSDGNFKEMRLYDKSHCLYLEIGYHKEKSLTGDNQTTVLHYHTYDQSFSKSKEGSGGRSKAKPLTAEMKEKYKKYFKGLKV
jgi:hypothetical protein